MSFSPDGRSVAVSTASGLVMVYSRKKNVSDDVQVFNILFLPLSIV